MIRNGKSIREVAEEAYILRKEAQAEARTLMNAEEVASIEAENIRRGWPKEGPTFEQLLQQYGSYMSLIQGSFRSNRAVDLLFLIWF
jgi:hypothetical protein